MNNKRKKVFIIAAVIIIALIIIGMITRSHRERVEYYNNPYGYTQHHQEEGQSLGETVVNSAVKGAVSGYVAGKVINHYANKNRANYNPPSYQGHYNNSGSFNNSHYGTHHHRYR